MTSLFYISAFLLLYAYVLYPALLFALSASQPRRARDSAGDAAAPSLSIIVAAYNEERCIAQKIENFLACRYSGDAELIVVSDGSSDRTAEIAELDGVGAGARDSSARAARQGRRGECGCGGRARRSAGVHRCERDVRARRAGKGGASAARQIDRIGDGSVALSGRDDRLDVPALRADAQGARIAAGRGGGGRRRAVRDAPRVCSSRSIRR